MAQPTLVYGGTTVTLAHPNADPAPEREVVEARIDRPTLSGYVRTSRMHWHYRYRLSFRHDLVATYDAVVALWNTAVAAGGFPTFTWSGGPWAGVTGGVTVTVKLSPIPTRHDFTRTDWTLELEEVTPR